VVIAWLLPAFLGSGHHHIVTLLLYYIIFTVVWIMFISRAAASVFSLTS